VATQHVFETFEVGFHHFHHRMGLQIPNSQRLIIALVRPRGVSDWNIFHETLTYADLVWGSFESP
jgi:hypothetical protein